jgi:hypothetical protein
MKKILLTLGCLLVILSSIAQTSPEDKLGAWYMYDGNHRVLDKFSITAGAQLRSFEVLDNINLLFLYTGVNYHLNKNTTLRVAYCFIDIDRSFLITGESHLYENRPYEQISYKHKLSNWPIYHRLRLEHRLLNFNHVHTNLNRFRYRLGTKIKLNKNLFINVNEEIFANLKGDVFTENRFYAALGLNISSSSNIQLGYLNHEINDLNLNRLQIGIFIKTDHRKKEVKN